MGPLLTGARAMPDWSGMIDGARKGQQEGQGTTPGYRGRAHSEEGNGKRGSHRTAKDDADVAVSAWAERESVLFVLPETIVLSCPVLVGCWEYGRRLKKGRAPSPALGWRSLRRGPSGR